MDPAFPLTWHLKKETAGGGPLSISVSHNVDLARFLIGEIDSVWPKREPSSRSVLPGAGAAPLRKNVSRNGRCHDRRRGLPAAQLPKRALGTSDVTRFAGGAANYNYFEVYGSKGACLESGRLNNSSTWIYRPYECRGSINIMVTRRTIRTPANGGRAVTSSVMRRPLSTRPPTLDRPGQGTTSPRTSTTGPRSSPSRSGRKIRQGRENAQR